MDENITAKNISRRFSGIQHTILGWNVKELDDGLFVYVNPIHYESCFFNYFFLFLLHLRFFYLLSLGRFLRKVNQSIACN